MDMNAIVIEDEKLVAKELIMKMAEIDSNIIILEVLPSVKSALKWFSENLEPDIIFADIQLLDGVSFKIFEKIHITCPIIFTTSYNEYAIRAFKVNGIDYLLKPVELGELERAIDKAKKILMDTKKPALDLNILVQMLKSGEETKPIYKEHFLCKHKRAWVPIRIEDISYFKYEVLIYIVTKNNEKYTMDYESLDEVKVMLDRDVFFRVNRQFIVNRLAVKEIWGIGNSKMMVKLKEPHLEVKLDISRQKAPIFKKWLEK